ncbi:MAG TPA: DUF2169 domain-containing protein [Acidobacteriota bacterium]|nr:DUF2169 domain-containing protein [Acidobacteriota bacterium]
MNLLNATGMAAGYTLGCKPDGRESVVVVVKGTFAIPEPGGEPHLHDQQVPLVDADTFTGEPGFSAPVYESDYALFKPRCDVLLNGSAYAPGGRPGQSVMVALKIGPITKSFRVVGDRVWQQGMAGFAASTPEFFRVKRISYDNAFGGVDGTNSDPNKHRWYPTNHAGVGYHHSLSLDAVVGKPLPNTEEADNPVTSPRGNYRPMAFGPIGRSWSPRPKYAGTYDQNWIDNVFPFLPADFKEDYYQAAPPDQQMPHLLGGEEVTLINLTPEGETTFALPTIAVPIEFTDASHEQVEKIAVIDTIIIEPDERRFGLVWRASLPLKRNILEMRQVVAGRMSRA